MSSDYTISREEWENRQLCSDGNCIGVIGPDGLCKECGRPGEGGPPPAAHDETSFEPPVTDGTSDVASTENDDATGEQETVRDDDDWANRRLCPDGNCIGVIGPDGICKECGRPEK